LQFIFILSQFLIKKKKKKKKKEMNNVYEENKCSDLRAVFTALESVVHHFPIAHIDDIGKRFSQFKEARVAHMQLPDTHPLYKRCSYCYSPYHKREKCPFILDYLVDEDEIVDNEEEHTKQVEHAQVTT
jgi:hypothetical protein